MPRHSDVLTGFAPILPAVPRILILGSMPSEASLDAGEYYAHPRNAFWPIMQLLLGFEPGLPYARRVEHLQQAGIALWDVVHQCRRRGSLDSAIDNDSIVVSDLAGLLLRHPQLRAVFCNGGTAWQLYQRHFCKHAKPSPITLPASKLPSTSPANARLSLQQKCEQWRVILKFLENG